MKRHHFYRNSIALLLILFSILGIFLMSLDIAGILQDNIADIANDMDLENLSKYAVVGTFETDAPDPVIYFRNESRGDYSSAQKKFKNGFAYKGETSLSPLRYYAEKEKEANIVPYHISVTMQKPMKREILPYGVLNDELYPDDKTKDCFVNGRGSNDIYTYEADFVPQVSEDNLPVNFSDPKLTEEEKAYSTYVHEKYLKIDKSLKDELNIFMDHNQIEGTTTSTLPNNIKTFLGNYAFDLQAPKSPVGSDKIIYFLEKSKSGKGDDFASATVMMLRARGIPARFVNGFLGVQQGGGENNIYGIYLHAWTEYYVDGSGWKYIDTTSSRADIDLDKLLGDSAMINYHIEIPVIKEEKELSHPYPAGMDVEKPSQDLLDQAKTYLAGNEDFENALEVIDALNIKIDNYEWYYDEAHTKLVTFPFKMRKENIDLYGVYKETVDPDDITLTFYPFYNIYLDYSFTMTGKPGEVVDTTTKFDPSKLPQDLLKYFPNNFFEEGNYYFDGYHLNSDFHVKYTEPLGTSIKVPYKSTSYYGQYTTPCTVHVNYYDGIDSKGNLTETKKDIRSGNDILYRLPSVAEKIGKFRFKGWQMGDDTEILYKLVNGYCDVNLPKFDSEVTFKAIYEDKIKLTVQVSSYETIYNGKEQTPNASSMFTITDGQLKDGDSAEVKFGNSMSIYKAGTYPLHFRYHIKDSNGNMVYSSSSKDKVKDPAYDVTFVTDTEKKDLSDLTFTIDQRLITFTYNGSATDVSDTSATITDDGNLANGDSFTTEKSLDEDGHVVFKVTITNSTYGDVTDCYDITTEYNYTNSEE